MMVNGCLQTFTNSRDNLSALQFSGISLLSLVVARPAKLCLEMRFTNKVCCYVKSQQVFLGSIRDGNINPQLVPFGNLLNNFFV